MRSLVVIGGSATAALCITAVFVVFDLNKDQTTSSSAPPQWSHTADEVLSDPVMVFRQAFWSHPSQDDRIEHAVRLHWLDDKEVAQWQWYIQLSPSPQLIDRLVTQNSFRLEETTTVEAPLNPPLWFRLPAESLNLSTSSQDMNLCYDETNKKLIAWAKGHGFSKKVAEPQKQWPSHTDPLPRRLPNHRPPQPSSQ